MLDIKQNQWKGDPSVIKHRYTHLHNPTKQETRMSTEADDPASAGTNDDNTPLPEPVPAEPPPPPLPPVLQLHVPQTPISDGAIQVQWCLTRAGREALAARGVTDAYVLFVVTPKGRPNPQTRQIAPLTDGVTYLGFVRPGEHNIFAMIIWPNKEMPHLADLNDHFLSKYRRWDYNTDVLGYNGTDLLSHVTFPYALPELSNVAQASVDIPEETFAKEPIDSWWANLWFKMPPLDQCAMRRRRILAYTIQPPVMLVVAIVVGLFLGIGSLLLGLVALWATLAGMRGINYRGILSPHSDSRHKSVIATIDFDSSIFLPTWKEHKLYFTLPLTPAFWGVLLSLLLIFPVEPHHWRSLNNALCWTGLLTAALVVLFAVIQIIGNLKTIVRAIQRLELSFIKLISGRDREAEAMAALVCDEGHTLARAPQHRTIRLKFLKTKAAVCRPYAQ